MSEEKTGFVKVYHPSGLLVTLPVSMESVDYSAMFGNIGNIIDAGFLANAPGCEEGEKIETIGFVVKRVKENEDHSVTPLIDMYPNAEPNNFSILSVYLNTEADVAAFESQAKVKLDLLKEYIGSNKIERGKSRQTDALVAKTAPFRIKYRANPKYDPKETDTTKKKPARLFAGYPDYNPKQDIAQQGVDTKVSESVQKWCQWVNGVTLLDDANKAIPIIEKKLNEEERKVVLDKLKQHMSGIGVSFDGKKFVEKKK